MQKSICSMLLASALASFAGCSPSIDPSESPFRYLTEEQKIAIAQEEAAACNCSCGNETDQQL